MARVVRRIEHRRAACPICEADITFTLTPDYPEDWAGCEHAENLEFLMGPQAYDRWVAEEYAQLNGELEDRRDAAREQAWEAKEDR